MRTLLALALLPLPAMAGTPEVVNDHILPATDRFATAAHALADAAGADCSASALDAPYQQAFDAWMGLSHLAFGPLEQDGRALTVAFWPDPRGLVARSVRGLVADQDPVVDDPSGFAEVSIAGRGLMALEQLMADEVGDYECRYARAIATDERLTDRDPDRTATMLYLAIQGAVLSAPLVDPPLDADSWRAELHLLVSGYLGL